MTDPTNDPYWQGPDERARMPVDHDPVNRPSHYLLPSGIEVIQAIEHLPFCRGAAVKYIIRAGNKAGADELQDLKKARWNIKREIRRMEALRAAPCEVGPECVEVTPGIATFQEDDGSTTEVDFASRIVTYVPPPKAKAKRAAKRRAR